MSVVPVCSNVSNFNQYSGDLSSLKISGRSSWWSGARLSSKIPSFLSLQTTLQHRHVWLYSLCILKICEVKDRWSLCLVSVQNSRVRTHALGRFRLSKYFKSFSFSQNLPHRSHDLRPVLLLFKYPALFPLKSISSTKMSALILCTSTKGIGMDPCSVSLVPVQNLVRKLEMSFGLLSYLNILGSRSVQKLWSLFGMIWGSFFFQHIVISFFPNIYTLVIWSGAFSPLECQAFLLLKLNRKVAMSGSCSPRLFQISLLKNNVVCLLCQFKNDRLYFWAFSLLSKHSFLSIQIVGEMKYVSVSVFPRSYSV